jgi:hypothetical protein
MDMFPVKQSKHFSLLKLSWGLAHVHGHTDSEEGQEGTENESRSTRQREFELCCKKKQEKKNQGVGLKVGGVNLRAAETKSERSEGP